MMRKINIAVLLALCWTVAAFAEPGAPNEVVVDAGNVRFPTAPDLWGIFFEDIDLSLDGGVYAEMVRNRSFEDGHGNSREFPLGYWDPVGNAECRHAEKLCKRLCAGEDTGEKCDSMR